MDTPDFHDVPRRRHGLATAGLIGSGIVLGALLAGSMTAQAADPTPSPSTTTTVPDNGPGIPGDLRDGSGGPHHFGDGRDCPDHGGDAGAGGGGGGGGSTTDTSPSTTPSQTNTPSV